LAAILSGASLPVTSRTAAAGYDGLTKCLWKPLCRYAHGRPQDPEEQTERIRRAAASGETV